MPFVSRITPAVSVPDAVAGRSLPPATGLAILLSSIWHSAGNTNSINVLPARISQEVTRSLKKCYAAHAELDCLIAGTGGKEPNQSKIRI